MKLSPPLFFRNPVFSGGVIQLPLRGVRCTSLPSTLLQNFSGHMFGKSYDHSEIPQQMLTSILKDPQHYEESYLGAITPLTEAAIETQDKEFGLDPDNWNKEAHQNVMTTQNQGDGHGVLVATLEPHPDPVSFIKDYRLMRYLGGSFPGQFASITERQMVQLLSAGRNIDGTPINKWEELLPSIVSHNAEQFAANAPVSGFHAIGWNSFVEAHHHFIREQEGVTVQSALFRTTFKHSQSGIVPWTAVYHPSFPKGIVFISLHFGKHPIPGGDAINSTIAPGLFKTIFRSGTLLSQFYPDLLRNYGEKRASALLLDGQNAKAFNQFVFKNAFDLYMDRGMFSSLDASFGWIYNWLNMFEPNEVAQVDTAKYEKVKTPEELNELLKEGIDRSDQEHFDGTAGFEKSVPTDIIPELGSSITGDVIQPPEENPFNPQTPLDESLKVDTVTFENIVEDWGEIQGEIAKEVRKHVESSIEKQDVLSKSPSEWAKELDSAALNHLLRKRMNEMLWVYIGSASDAKDAINNLQEDGVKALIDISLTQQVFNRMISESEGTSWIKELVTSTILDARNHALYEQADKIQEQIYETASQMDNTSSELSSKQETMEKVKQELAHQPQNADLKSKLEELQHEIDKLVREQRRLEELRSEAEAEKRESKEDYEKNEESRERSKRELERRGREVFYER